MFTSLVASLVLTKLDYANALLSGISVGLKDPLQLVLNAAARVIHGLGRQNHITQVSC